MFESFDSFIHKESIVGLKNNFKKVVGTVVLGSAVAFSCLDFEPKKDVLVIGTAFNGAADVKGSAPMLEKLSNTGVPVLTVHVSGDKLEAGKSYEFREENMSLFIDGDAPKNSKIVMYDGQLAVSGDIKDGAKIESNFTEGNVVAKKPYEDSGVRFDPAVVAKNFGKNVEIKLTSGTYKQSGVSKIR